MYVPPFESLLRSLGTDRENFEIGENITIPTKFLKLLLQMALEGGEFDEAVYLEANPDVAEAFAAGDVEDPRRHYIEFGYFEGRAGGAPKVDEGWYLATYKDVAKGISLGHVSSAAQHYHVIGGSEGRSPNPRHVDLADKWKKVLVQG